MNNPPREYGYWYDPPDCRPGDEHWLDGQKKWDGCVADEPEHCTNMDNDRPTRRRRIDPGPDHDIVPPDDVIRECDQYFYSRDSGTWLATTVAGSKVSENLDAFCLAYRRPKPACGWVRFSERKPNENEPKPDPIALAYHNRNMLRYERVPIRFHLGWFNTSSFILGWFCAYAVAVLSLIVYMIWTGSGR